MTGHNIKILLFVFLFQFSVFPGCKEIEKNLTLKEEKLIAVLLDVHIAEAAIQPLYELEKDSMMHIYYDQIFLIHEVDMEEFFDNVRIIRQNPTLSEKIYTKVMEEFNKLESTQKTEYNNPKKK